MAAFESSEILSADQRKEKIKLIALDLDGTTLNSHHSLSAATKQALQHLSQRGVIVCLATGRSSNSVIPYITELSLPQPIVPVVCFNGCRALLVDNTSTSTEPKVSTALSFPHSEASTRMLLRFAAERNLLAQYYNGETGDVMICPTESSHVELAGRYAGLVGKPQTVLTSFDDAIATCLPQKLLVFVDESRVDWLIAEAAAHLPADTFHVIRGSPFPFFVEFLPFGACKGECVRQLCATLGVEMSAVAAFGDGDNNIEMLQVAGCGVAMRNAKQVTKDAADIVIEVFFVCFCIIFILILVPCYACFVPCYALVVKR